MVHATEVSSSYLERMNAAESSGSSHIVTVTKSLTPKKKGTLCDFPPCGLPASGSCSGCKVVGYCSSFHRHCDWESHKKSCSRENNCSEEINIDKNLTMRVTKKLQNSYEAVVSDKAIGAGKLLLTEEPVIVFPNIEYAFPCSNTLCQVFSMNHFLAPHENDPQYFYSELLDEDESPFDPVPTIPQVCFGCCGTRDEGLLWECQHCGVPLCGQACEEESEHKDQECNFLRERKMTVKHYHSRVEFLYTDIATLRGLLSVRSSRQNYQQILNLRKHPRVENFRRSAKYRVFQAYGSWLYCLPLSCVLTDGDCNLVDDVFSVVHALSGICTSKKSRKSLYLFWASLQHSCLPNCTISPYRTDFSKSEYKIAIITTQGIAKDEHLTVDVVRKPLFISCESRRWYLQRQYIFDCNCDFCSDPTNCATYVNAIKCDLCNLHLLPLRKSFTWYWSCEDSSCSGKKEWWSVKAILDKAKATVSIIPRSRGSIGKFLTLRKTLLTQFHRNHYIILGVEGIVGKLALRPVGLAWGGVKALIDLRHLTPYAAKDYNYILQYYSQLARFLRTPFTVERAIILRNVFHAEILLLFRNFRDININLHQTLVHLRAQLRLLEESRKTFKAYYHPAWNYIGSKSEDTENCFRTGIQTAERLATSMSPRNKIRRGRNGNNKYENGTFNFKFHNMLIPILERVLVPDPLNENFVL